MQFICYPKCTTCQKAKKWLDANGVANLAPYSQFTNLSFDPPYVLVAINQMDGRRKDTTNNIEQTGEFVYNLVSYDLRDAMNISSAGFDPDVDEFEKAGLTKAPSVIVKAPRVAESPIQFECQYVVTLRIPGNIPVGSADLIVGKVVGVHIKDEFIGPDDKIDMEKIRPLARMGYSEYTCVDHVFEITPPNDIGKADEMAMGLEGNFSAFHRK